MVTFAQAQERAERWINADVPGYQSREVKVREFDLGFVVWSEPRDGGPSSDDGGSVRVVIARDSGEATLWPGLPVGELIRRYEEEYGAGPVDAVPEPPQRLDLEATSFLLSPPQWLQDAADRMGIPDRRSSTSGGNSATFGRSAPGFGGGWSGSGDDSPASPSSSPPAGIPEQASASTGSGGIDYRRPGDTGGAVPGGAEGQSAAAPADTGPGSLAADAAGAVSGTGEGSGRDAGTADAAPSSGPADASGASGADYSLGAASPGPSGASGSPASSESAGPADSSAGSAAGSPSLGRIDYRRPTAPEAPAAPAAPAAPTAQASSGSGSWAGKTVSDSGEGQSVAVPATVFAPPISDVDLPQEPPRGADAPTELMPGGSSLPRTMLTPQQGEPPAAPPRPGVPYTMGGSPYPAPSGPSVPLPPPVGAGGSGVADLAAARAAREGMPPAPGGDVPPPPPYAGTPPPGAGNPPPPYAGTPGPGDPHYAATMLAGPTGPPPPPGAGTPPPGPGAPPPPPPYGGAPQPGPGNPPPPYAGTPGPGDPHYAATMLAGPTGPPPPPGAGTPPPGAGAPPQGPGSPHYAATMLAGPIGTPPGAGGPQPPPPPPGVGTPPPGQGTPPPPQGNDPHYAATMLAGPTVPPPGPAGAAMPPPPPPAYGYPQGGSVPTVGPGYMAVLRYRGQDGSEQQLIRRSAPGTPHPEWQILHELRSLGVGPDQVLELHTELESCDLPGGYCTRMIRETWPQVRISHTAPYGRDHASRRQGVQHLLTHQGELHQVAGAPARPQPQRVPMPDPHGVLRVPPVGLDVIGQELAGAFGPQGVFRFDQRAVSRQGVPDIVAQTLVWSGLPVDFGPFFWAQAQPGQPVPTLAELAAQRGVQPSPDSGSYLVMGNDFGRQLCVQYGTAHIVAVPLEAGPGGQPVPPQFVNSSLPEFARCLALLGRMWRLRIGLTPEQAGRWTVDFQAQLAAQDPAAIASPDNWWSVLIEQMWDGLL